MRAKPEAEKKKTAFQNETNTLVYDFIKHHSVGTLATVDEQNKPYGSVIYYAVDDHFIFRFTTKTGTKKHHNLQKNPNAMLVVYDAASQTVAQIGGQAISIDNSLETRQIFLSMLEASLSTSDSGVPPISKLMAGYYVGYEMRPETITFTPYGKPRTTNRNATRVIDFLPKE